MPTRRAVTNQSKSFARQKRTRLIIFIVAIVVVISGGIFGASYLSRLSTFTIQVIEVSGADQEIIGSVRAAAEESLKGNYLHLFSRANVFLYPKEDIKRAVMAASSRIEDVQVKHNKLTGLTISVKEKEADALVCPTFPDFNEGKLILENFESCLFADQKGILYAKAISIASTSLDTYNLYFAPAAKEVATSTEEFKALQSFYVGLKKNHIDIQAILFKEKGEYEAYVRTTGATTVIYFNNTRPLSVELDNLILFWNHALAEAKAKGGQRAVPAEARIPVYEYIDVRYGSNVFFREVK
ncbi:MAG: hypothetical protein V4481_02880 [Patescibacteria group bacterium]